jgi:hypothetical protein
MPLISVHDNVRAGSLGSHEAERDSYVIADEESPLLDAMNIECGFRRPAQEGQTSVDDKTFGMKNKRGSTAKKQIAQLEAQSKSSGSPEEKKKQAEKQQKAKEKAAETPPN